MLDVKSFFNELEKDSEKRYADFAIEEIGSIKKITEDAYLEKPTWLGGDEEFVCLFIDLDHSSKISFKKHPKTMAKIYDYFTQNIVDILNQESIKADYIDIKGDGAFGIYEGKNAAFKALCAAITFKSFFENYIRPKFKDIYPEFNCKIGIHQDKILVKKIGIRGDNNEVWAGRVVNNAAKISSLSKEIREKDGIDPDYSILVVSEKIYSILATKHDHAIMSCDHDRKTWKPGNAKQNIWRALDISQSDEVFGDKVYHTTSCWCQAGCCQENLENLLKL